MPYVVFVGDNFHYMDPDETYRSGEFINAEDAIAHCRRMADQYLESSLKPEMCMRPGMSPCRPYSAGDGSQEVAAQRCGSSSSMRLAGCVGSRSSTSLKYA